MNSKERMMTALARKTPDMVPVFLRDLTLGLDVLGLTTPEVCNGGPHGHYDADKSAEAVVACWKRFGHDCVVGSIHDLCLAADALGGETEFPLYGVPHVLKFPFAAKSRLCSAKVPHMDRDGRLPGYLRAVELVKQRIGDTVAIAANVEGPVTQACLLRGMPDLAVDFVRDPAFARDLVEFSTEMVISHIGFLAQAGADFVFVAAAADGPVFIRPEMYLSYTIPSLKRIVDTSDELGLKVVFHPHGNFTHVKFRPLVDAAIETGIAGFQFPENCDLAIAKQLWGGSVAILGGIDIPHVLHPGPPELVRQEARKCLKNAAHDGGYVFMETCSLHRGDSLEHIDAMVKTVREFGSYENLDSTLTK